MEITLHRSHESISCELRELDDFWGFAVLLDPDVSISEAKRSLTESGAGRLAEDARHAWISLEWLRTQIGEQDSWYWCGFDAMVSYASKKGWLSPDQDALLGHLEQQPAPATGAQP